MPKYVEVHHVITSLTGYVNTNNEKGLI